MYNAFNNLTSLYQPASAYSFQSQQKQEVIKVNGRDGAAAFQLAPNSNDFT